MGKAHEVGGGSAEAAVAAEVAMIGGGVCEELVPAGLAVGMPWSDCSGGMFLSLRSYTGKTKHCFQHSSNIKMAIS